MLDTVASLSGLPGSGKYLLTDAGGLTTSPDSLAVIDTSDCRGGAVVTPVAEFPKTAPMLGIDFEWMGLPSTDEVTLRNHGGTPPFAGFVVAGAWGNSVTVVDISACGFRATFGGSGDDMCPYP